MKPILYSSITEGTVPTHYGVGVLDCISCQVLEERNGSYELTMEYPSEGIHASEIVPNAILKVKPNYTDNPQLFRIYKVGKSIGGSFECYASHISYDLSGKVITAGTASDIVSACNDVLTPAASPFTITTSKSGVGDFKITEPSSVRSWFGGKSGSLLDVYGGGEWHYDNYTAKLWNNRGTDRGVTIRYGKNLTELSQEIDMSNLCTGIIPFYKDADGNITSGTKVSTGLVLDVDKDEAIDFSQEIDPESATPILTQLANAATAYIGSHNFLTANNNITLDFVQLKGLTERVDLCDTVHIYFEPLGISASMKCISTTWDCLEERYIKTEFGDPKGSITTTILDTSTAAAEAQTEATEANSNAQTAITRVGEKKRVFVDTPVPPYDIGDLWTNGDNLFVCVNPKDITITDSVSGTNVSFDSPLETTLLRCLCTIPADPDGFSSITIVKEWEEEGVPQTESFFIDLGETLTQGGVYNALTGELVRTDLEVIQLDSYEILTEIGVQSFHTDIGGNIDIEYLIKGFQESDWDKATEYTTQNYVEEAIGQVTSLITGTSGGYVVMNRDVDGHPYEILIMDNPDITLAVNVLRMNQDGIGFSSTGYQGPFTNAITGQGIVADAITSGNLDAQVVTIQNLTATMFKGGKLTLGGLNNQSGTLELLDESGIIIGELTKEGLKFYGAGPIGQRPYVVLNNTDGFKGFDANDNPLFWVSRDEFVMTKCVAQTEITACNKIRFIPMQISSGGIVVNDGVAVVALV